MNLILENSKYVDYYTYLDDILREVSELQDYEWFISDLECYSDLLINESWMSGKELLRITNEHEIQIIWGVFSALTSRRNILTNEIPYADCNDTFWKEDNVETQLTDAQFEIVCWDSSLTLFINCNIEIVKKLKKLYPDIKDLDGV